MREWQYAENWQWVELSTLGEIDGLQFALETTKQNSWGATTPAYFCIDNIGGEKTDCTLGEMTKVEEPAESLQQTETEQPKATKRLINGQLYIEQNDRLYTITGMAL